MPLYDILGGNNFGLISTSVLCFLSWFYHIFLSFFSAFLPLGQAGTLSIFPNFHPCFFAQKSHDLFKTGFDCITVHYQLRWIWQELEVEPGAKDLTLLHSINYTYTPEPQEVTVPIPRPNKTWKTRSTDSDRGWYHENLYCFIHYLNKVFNRE